jgi:hypothetical protein
VTLLFGFKDTMRLDNDAARYAYLVFSARQEEVMEALIDQTKEVWVQTQPGQTEAELFKKFATAINDASRELLEARADSLIQAVEKSGANFDDGLLNDFLLELARLQTAYADGRALLHQIEPYMRRTGSYPSEFLKQLDAATGRAFTKAARKLEIKRDEIRLNQKRTVYAAAMGKNYDVFVSHASEDKEAFVRPLARALADSGLSIWFDEMTLKIGDSLRRKIDEGLAKSRFGVVVLSHHFFAKEWPQHELDGLFGKEISGVKVILPVWHNITAEEVQQYSPMIGGRLAARSQEGIQVVVSKLREAMGLVPSGPSTLSRAVSRGLLCL